MIVHSDYNLTMSSIYSDIFYGSKQNLLDNYLINRQGEEQDKSSLPRDEPSAPYSSSIQLVIAVPIGQGAEGKSYQVRVEMGNKSDENLLEIEKGGEGEMACVLLTLNDLEKQDLGRYTSIKITISEGRYKGKVFAYIPIESVRQLVGYAAGEKTVTLQVKGKQSLGFGSIQCTIRADFPSNNILSSDILHSVDKDYSSVSRQRSREEVSAVSGASQKEPSYWEERHAEGKQTRPKGHGQPVRRPSPHRQKPSSNIYAESGSLI
jgi:hypothetical protein